MEGMPLVTRSQSSSLLEFFMWGVSLPLPVRTLLLRISQLPAPATWAMLRYLGSNGGNFNNLLCYRQSNAKWLCDPLCYWSGNGLNLKCLAPAEIVVGHLLALQAVWHGVTLE